MIHSTRDYPVSNRCATEQQSMLCIRDFHCICEQQVTGKQAKSSVRSIIVSSGWLPDARDLCHDFTHFLFAHRNSVRTRKTRVSSLPSFQNQQRRSPWGAKSIRHSPSLFPRDRPDTDIPRRDATAGKADAGTRKG